MTTIPPDLDALLRSASITLGGIGGPCELHHHLVGGRLVLVIKGSTSSSLPDAFTGAVELLFERVRPQAVAVDLSACPQLHSVMLAFIAFFHKTAKEHGAGKVVLYGINPRIATTLKMIGMADFFVVVKDAAAADAHFAGG